MKCAESWSKICIQPLNLHIDSSAVYIGRYKQGSNFCDEPAENGAEMAFGPVF